MSIAREQITGVVLAGGLGRRMRTDGQSIDKGLRLFRGKALIAHAIDALKPQVGLLCINANGPTEPYQRFELPIIADEPQEFAGPLAGLASALSHTHTDWVLTVPCDCPFLPADLAARMAAALGASGKTLAVACCAGVDQPVFLLAHRSLLGGLRSYLQGGGRKIDTWYARLDPERVPFEDAHAFVNINTLEELKLLE